MGQSDSSSKTGLISRRALLQLAAIGVVGLGAGAGMATIATRLGKSRPRLYRFFSESEASLVIAICEQLIPRDDAPGATDAGVIRYIDRQLAGNLARHQRAYRGGLQSLQRMCLAEYKATFEALVAEQKAEVLRRVESGEVPDGHWDDPTAPQFFRLVLGHTMQGFYGPARHGGNRDFISYNMLGLPYPQVLGQNRYPKS